MCSPECSPEGWRNCFPTGKDTQVLFSHKKIKSLWLSQSEGVAQGALERLTWPLAQVIGVYPRQTVRALIPPEGLGGEQKKTKTWKAIIAYSRMGNEPTLTALERARAFLQRIFLDQGGVEVGLESMRSGHSIILELNRKVNSRANNAKRVIEQSIISELVALVVFQKIKDDTILVTHIAVATERRSTTGAKKCSQLH